jgi:hypothetical protein
MVEALIDAIVVAGMGQSAADQRSSDVWEEEVPLLLGWQKQ